MPCGKSCARCLSGSAGPSGPRKKTKPQSNDSREAHPSGGRSFSSDINVGPKRLPPRRSSSMYLNPRTRGYPYKPARLHMTRRTSGSREARHQTVEAWAFRPAKKDVGAKRPTTALPLSQHIVEFPHPRHHLQTSSPSHDTMNLRLARSGTSTVEAQAFRPAKTNQQRESAFLCAASLAACIRIIAHPTHHAQTNIPASQSIRHPLLP
jgi:hypothetical protein